MPDPDERAGDKAPEFWILQFRDIVEKALEDALDENSARMCNIVKRVDPELVEMSERQHTETIDKIDSLVKALYVSCGVLMGLGVVMTGSIFFTISILVAK